MSKSVSIIIPVYNEEKTIEHALKNILNLFRKQIINFEIIVVIDIAPNDKTLEIVKSLSETNNEIVYFSRKNKLGVASAITLGIENAKNDISMIVMGDSSEDPNDLVMMVKKMDEGYDMVFANRFSNESTFKDYPQNKFFANRLCNNTVRLLFGISSKDITNAVKAYHTRYLKQIKITSVGFEIFIELPIKSYLLGATHFAEVPANHFAGDASLSKFNLLNEGFRYFKMIVNCILKKDLSK